MKLALFGYGKMGKMIEACASACGHEVVAKIGSQTPEQEWGQVEKADICIDFSHPACVLAHVQHCVKHKKNLIMGTTGWEHQEEQVREIIKAAEIGCLYSPNFSIGIHLFMRMIEQAAQLINPFDDYDVGAIESHHRHKIDSPSGTAKELTRQLAKHMPRAKDLQFASVRCGFIPGTHTIQFDSPADTITLTHQARHREGFAKGAIRAAEWMQGKRGFYTMSDLLDQLTHSE